MPQSHDAVYAAVLAAATGMLESGITAGTSGNVSARLDDGHIVITPSSMPYQQMTPAIWWCSISMANRSTGQRPPSSETLLHLACYRAFDEIGAVLHSHPPHATMFACARRPVPASDRRGGLVRRWRGAGGRLRHKRVRGGRRQRRARAPRRGQRPARQPRPGHGRRHPGEGTSPGGRGRALRTRRAGGAGDSAGTSRCRHGRWRNSATSTARAALRDP